MRFIAVVAIAVSVAIVGSAAPVAKSQAPLSGTPVASGDVITLVMWYEYDPGSDSLALRHLQTGADGGVNPAELASSPVVGHAVFDVETNGWTIEVGGSKFEDYSLNPDDSLPAYQWLWFNGEENRRPATLFMQILPVSGPFVGSNVDATATFASRSGGDGAEQFSSGVLVILLRFP